MSNYPFVPYELPDTLRKQFSMETIINRQDLTAEEKIAYYKAISEVCSFLDFCIYDRKTN